MFIISYFSCRCTGDSAIIVGVNGPIEAKSQKMLYDRISIEATYTPVKGPSSKPCTNQFLSFLVDDSVVVRTLEVPYM